ncbi:hypothetical protein LY78DRAFT_31816 [Colletotrichum sublineola]|nr:hypothetical protein LY78DRAFT_31816 [Colletotrichum sublineola]
MMWSSDRHHPNLRRVGRDLRCAPDGSRILLVRPTRNLFFFPLGDAAVFWPSRTEQAGSARITASDRRGPVAFSEAPQHWWTRVCYSTTAHTLSLMIDQFVMAIMEVPMPFLGVHYVLAVYRFILDVFFGK